jgi:hypothetical protein
MGGSSNVSGVITLDNVIETLKSEDIINISPVYNLEKKPKYWKVLKPITFKTSFGKTYTIPEGFITDLCTVPRFLWGYFPPFGYYTLAYLIHDFLYIHKQKGLSRLDVDEEMFIWAQKLNPNKKDNFLRYIIVLLTGWLYWYKLIKFNK